MYTPLSFTRSQHTITSASAMYEITIVLSARFEISASVDIEMNLGSSLFGS